ncbi:hypothetical protein HNR19_003721 [Nocardioides thalensis]|uniref:Uncharacterized protein n=1 Tax=Nocardioides thalensis TaxID=1914755 RepID=A0A853C9Y2_9ACTN|nr:hypothetical protein [Nocardioides thalensis]NYJ03023.1 hypothetical protein [Nocardioides thalensis]
MSQKTEPFPPYSTREELARGRRKMFVYLAITVGAAVLAMIAAREVGDGRLVTAYVVAAVMHLASALGPAIRWSRTPELEGVG